MRHRKFGIVCFVYISYSFENGPIAALHNAGVKGPDFARQTGHPLPTIYGVLHRFKGRGSLENKEKTGRPNLLTPRDTRKLCTTVKSDRKRPLHEITAVFNELREESIAKRTVQRKLYEEGYKRYDNSLAHRAKSVKEYMEQNQLHGMEWPAQSTDLNIIENMWRKIKLELQKQAHNIRWRQQFVTYGKIYHKNSLENFMIRFQDV
ncbi:unnamed protein product [Mytilus coruscus]|uniref:Tc1-like transposase DDE domain-containing protein n=1 Tax=Mytilus coruscus TaxID=42192 RepID=A0A6J8BJT4_MYTCO|nr:unnamed protein product [Mytilus coruscus]